MAPKRSPEINLDDDDFDLPEEEDLLGDEGDLDLEDGDTDLNIATELEDDGLDIGEQDVAPAPPPKRSTAKSPPAATAKKSGIPLPPRATAEPLGAKAVSVTADIPVQLVAVLGKKTMTLQDLLQLQASQVIELGVPVTTSVDLVANGKLVAKGELVEIDGTMGVRIVQLVK
ncbi:MAG: FliM/FliN family flagellar motor switch protein [Deltaproteobacteria bacterium]|nr:FliM/FliN family flagellar motor switch protein [Deltaproteobacteria bacterium]